MDGAEEDLERRAFSRDSGIDAVETGEAFIGADEVGGDVPIPCPDAATGRQRQLEPFNRLGLVSGETDAFGDFGHEDHDAGGLAAFIGDRSVVEVKPGGFRTGSPIQHQLLPLKRPGLSCEAASNIGVVEIRDFRPALAGAHPQELRMPLAGETRIAVIVEEDA